MGLTVIKHSLHMADMVGTTRQAIDTLHVQTKKLNSLETLIHEERHGSSIPSIQVVQRHTKDRFQRREIRLEALVHWRRPSHWNLAHGRDTMGWRPSGWIGRPTGRGSRRRLCWIRCFPKLVRALLCLAGAGAGNIEGRERWGKCRLAFSLGTRLCGCSWRSTERLPKASVTGHAFSRSEQLTGWR